MPPKYLGLWRMHRCHLRFRTWDVRFWCRTNTTTKHREGGAPFSFRGSEVVSYEVKSDVLNGWCEVWVYDWSFHSYPGFVFWWRRFHCCKTKYDWSMENVLLLRNRVRLEPGEAIFDGRPSQVYIRLLLFCLKRHKFYGVASEIVKSGLELDLQLQIIADHRCK